MSPRDWKKVFSMHCSCKGDKATAPCNHAVRVGTFYKSLFKELGVRGRATASTSI